MSVLHAAVPAFLGLIALEWGAARLRGSRVYSLRDSLADLGCGILSQLAGVFLALLSLAAYAWVGEHAALQRWLPLPGWPGGGPTASAGLAALWLAVFVLVDLGQYWVHRASHHIAVLWACHVVHHSSEELNYAVALRNSSLHGLFIWVTPLPLAIAGVPWQVFAICYGLNVAWQFWLHTRLIGKLGPLEAVLNTPSHHRVHHGRDAEYVDRNFGGVLIVWDRLFGTFAEERSEPDYGVSSAPASSDPLWANMYGFVEIGRQLRRAGSTRERMGAILGRPLWEPAGKPAAAVAPQSIESDVRGPMLYYALGQFAAVFGATLWVLPRLGSIPLVDVALFGILVTLTLTGISGILDRKAWARRLESSRLLALLVVALVLSLDPGEGPGDLLAAYVGVSLTWLVLARGSASRQRPPAWRRAAFRLRIGAPGFEPGTFCSQSRRATGLRHTPRRET